MTDKGIIVNKYVIYLAVFVIALVGFGVYSFTDTPKKKLYVSSGEIVLVPLHDKHLKLIGYLPMRVGKDQGLEGLNK